MKYSPRIVVASFLLFATTLSAQVGIGTTEPTSTLDVNGDVRIRSLQAGFYPEGEEIIATDVVGMDGDGNLTRIKVSDNIRLIDNELIVVENKLRIGDIPELDVTNNHDLDLVIWPGEPNQLKSVIRIQNNSGDTIVTGIRAGFDGQHIILYPISGKLTLKGLDNNSLPENQFAGTGNVIIKEYQTIEIFYDASIQKWVIM